MATRKKKKKIPDKFINKVFYSAGSVCSKITKSVKDIENLSFEDFEIIDYKYHPAIKAPMAV